MANINFNKFNKVKNIEVKICEYQQQQISVKQYLPLDEKLHLMQSVIEQSGNGEEGFFNIVKLETYYVIEMIAYFTNITFSEKVLKDTPKLYDSIVLNGLWEFLKGEIPVSEQEYIWNTILTLAREITAFNNSILGILKTVSNDGSDLNAKLKQAMDSYAQDEELRKAMTAFMGQNT